MIAMDIEKEAREDFKVLREMEAAWLSDELTRSISNLGYPVGLGVGPSKNHADLAAKAIVGRYIDILWRIRQTAFSAGEESGREAAAKIVDAECERILSKQSPAKTDLEDTVNMNIRLTAIMLPDLAKSIRSLPLSVKG